MTRRITQRDRIKRHLLDHGTITNVEAVSMKILRLSERIRELQEQGMQIEGSREQHGVYRYTILNRPPRLVWMQTPEKMMVQVRESRIEEAKRRGLTPV